MWFLICCFKIIKKIIDVLIYFSSIVAAIKTLKYFYITLKNNKDDMKNYLVNACLKIYNLIFKEKKSLLNKLNNKETPFSNILELKNTIIWI